MHAAEFADIFRLPIWMEEPELHGDTGGSVHKVEGQILRGLASRVGAPEIIEIGTFRGISTRWLANANPKIKIHTFDKVDLWAGPELPNVTRNIKDVSDLDYVLSRARLWFIDGGHDFASVRRDTQLAIANGACHILWHDTSPSVQGRTDTEGKPIEVLEFVKSFAATEQRWMTIHVDTPCGMVFSTCRPEAFL